MRPKSAFIKSALQGGQNLSRWFCSCEKKMSDFGFINASWAKAVQRLLLAELDALFASLQHRAFRGKSYESNAPKR
jgi:hypothetical protein